MVSRNPHTNIAIMYTCPSYHAALSVYLSVVVVSDDKDNDESQDTPARPSGEPPLTQDTKTTDENPSMLSRKNHVQQHSILTLQETLLNQKKPSRTVQVTTTAVPCLAPSTKPSFLHSYEPDDRYLQLSRMPRPSRTHTNKTMTSREV